RAGAILPRLRIFAVLLDAQAICRRTSAESETGARAGACFSLQGQSLQSQSTNSQGFSLIFHGVSVSMRQRSRRAVECAMRERSLALPLLGIGSMSIGMARRRCCRVASLITSTNSGFSAMAGSFGSKEQSALRALTDGFRNRSKWKEWLLATPSDAFS